MLALLLAIILTWTAPGDDGHVGTATAYDLRYSTDSATVAGWNYATQAIGEPAPHLAGTTETYQLTLPPGTYWFAIRSKDEAGNLAQLSNFISKSQSDTGSLQVITSDHFETGFGNYTDGGQDCLRPVDSAQAHQGSSSVGLQDNSATSHLTTTTGRNVAAFTSMEVEFWFKMVGMEPGEDFWLEYSPDGGSTWQSVTSFACANGPYQNGTWYRSLVSLSRSAYTFSSNARLRFRCDASSNQDDVYLDDVVWRGRMGTNMAIPDEPGELALRGDVIVPDSFVLEQNYPNPFNPTTWVAFELRGDSQVEIEVFNILGRHVATLASGRYPAGRHVVQWDARGSASGAYFCRMQAGPHVQTRRMMVLK